MADRIVRDVDLKAPVARVWRALTDHEEFGQWFLVRLDGAFRPGAVSTGMITYPGYEHYPWRALVERMEPERFFSFRWHDFEADSGVDLALQPTTLVEFELGPTATGTRLRITESGFEALSEERRAVVLRNNTEGWNIQAANIAAHVAT